MTSLVQKVIEIAVHFEAAGVPYAFGGALALAYCTEDPRGTRDIDVNAFLPATHPDPALAALPPGVLVPEDSAARIVAEGQVRLWWDDTPVDLFLDYAPLHRQAAEGSRDVPFAGRQIRVLGPVEIVLFKALFDRPQDWVDISTVVGADAVDRDRVEHDLVALVGDDDPRVARWRTLLG